MEELRKDARNIWQYAIDSVLPDAAVKKVLKGFKRPDGKLYLLSIGKAGWSMAKAAMDVLGTVDDGVVITKYEHVVEEIKGVRCYEAGHPVLDENGVNATAAALEMVKNLNENDQVIFLISGGGSALFECPLVPLASLQDVNVQLLKCGASIQEINVIRKRLSAVKGGKFAKLCAPARILSIVLSDVVGDDLATIASGPCVNDPSTLEDIEKILAKYPLHFPNEVMQLLRKDAVKDIDNVDTLITGSVRELCVAASTKAKELGYETVMLGDEQCGNAREFGEELGRLAKQPVSTKTAYIAGGETTVIVKGDGLGGRNQEIALAAALGIDSLKACVFSIGSDGTDGPTDAAGGVVDGMTLAKLKEKGMDIHAYLENNDSYHALKEVDGLIMTGPTGTNVNDLMVLLVK